MRPGSPICWSPHAQQVHLTCRSVSLNSAKPSLDAQSPLLAIVQPCPAFSVPSLLKLSIVVPIFKLGGHSMPDNYRPASLACCCFKSLEHVVPSWIAVHISNQVDHVRVASGGEQMPWLVLSSNVLQTRFSTHTHVAFVDTKKAFDTSWVEATLVPLQESQGFCGLSLPISSVKRSPKCNWVHSCRSLVTTETLLRAGCCRLFC